MCPRSGKDPGDGYYSVLKKTFSPAEVEARCYALWEKSGAFACGNRAEADPYVVMMPPPNVTGALHIGHALTFTLQDILIRYHRLQGRDVLWQPGTDHAGIATQMVVERQLAATGVSRRDLGREAFIDHVWSWKEQSGDAIMGQLRRLGASPDWSRQRFTLDDGLSAAVRKVFVTLYRQGLIYRDKRLVNWDPQLKTAISDLEVDQREHVGTMWRFRYRLADDPARYIVVSTTRPETMFGDVAVAVHPEDERYRDFINKQVVLPIAERLIPVIADTHADPQKGSGAVKITPAHDFDDFAVGQRHDLPALNIFDAEACLNEEVPASYRGLERFAARTKVVAEMQERGLLDGVEENPMVIPHGDRSGVVIEPWLTDQWYVDAQALAAPAIEAVEEGRVCFKPQHWENTYFEWLRHIQPWCISRQLWWGHRIPAWYGPDGQVFIAESFEEARDQAHTHYGEMVDLEQDSSVLDTWFSSALWPFSTLGWPEKNPDLQRYYPTNVLVTGFDIIFFWVARMIMMGLHFMKDVPFATVYIHALVRDERGQKMSKSKGNVIDPLDMIERYGCDAVRFTLAALAGPGRDINLGESVLAGYRNFATKLWNAGRFCEMNGVVSLDCPEFDPASCRLPVNRWIISQTTCLARDVAVGIESYRFNDAASCLYQFVWGVFCDWYLEFLKPIFSGHDDAAKIESRKAAAWSLSNILRIIHPIMPYVSEELHGCLSDQPDGPLIASHWPKLSEDLIDDAVTAEMDWAIRFVTTIRALRAEANLPASQRLSVDLYDANETTRGRLATHRSVLLDLARLERIDYSDEKIDGAGIQSVLDEATMVVAVSGVVDCEAEKKRLTKEIARQISEIDHFDKKLANRHFLQKAPQKVVDEQKRKRLAAAETLDKLKAALQRIDS